MLSVISISTCLITTLVAAFKESDTKVVKMRFSLLYYIVISVQFSCSVMSDSWRPHGLVCLASLSITNSWSLLILMSIELVMS